MKLKREISFRPNLLLWFCVALTSLLISCGGGGGGGSVQGVSSGNSLFHVTNNTSQDFTSVNLTSNASSSLVYKGEFSCKAYQTCYLAINYEASTSTAFSFFPKAHAGAGSISAEGYTITFYNDSNDLVGGFLSASPPKDFTSVDASLNNLGNYIVWAYARAGSTSSTIATDRGTLIANLYQFYGALDPANATSIDTVTSLGSAAHLLSMQSGPQGISDIHKILTNAITGNLESGQRKLFVSAIALSQDPKADTHGIACPAPTGAQVAKKGINEVLKISSYLPLLGLTEFPFAKEIGKALGLITDYGCDLTQKKLDLLQQTMDGLSAKLDKVNLNIVYVQAQLDQLASFTYMKSVKDYTRNINDLLGEMETDVKTYQSQLTKTKSANIAEFFENTGGLTSISSNAPRYNDQRAMLGLMNRLPKLYEQLQKINNAPYSDLATSLNKVCLPNGLSMAEGNAVELTHVCNGISLNIMLRTIGTQRLATNMINDLIAYQHIAKIGSWDDPTQESDLADSQSKVNALGVKILTNAVSLSTVYSAVDSINPSLKKMVIDANCSQIVKDLDGNDIARPGIEAWYPLRTVTRSGPYFVTACSNGTTIVNSKLYYNPASYDDAYASPITKVKNIAGVLVDATYDPTIYSSIGKTDIIATAQADFFMRKNGTSPSNPGAVFNLDQMIDMISISYASDITLSSSTTDKMLYSMYSPSKWCLNGEAPSLFCSSLTSLFIGNPYNNWPDSPSSPSSVGKGWFRPTPSGDGLYASNSYVGYIQQGAPQTFKDINYGNPVAVTFFESAPVKTAIVVQDQTADADTRFYSYLFLLTLTNKTSFTDGYGAGAANDPNGARASVLEAYPTHQYYLECATLDCKVLSINNGKNNAIQFQNGSKPNSDPRGLLLGPTVTIVNTDADPKKQASKHNFSVRVY